MGKGSRKADFKMLRPTADTWDAAMAEATKKGANISQIADKYGVKRPTLMFRHNTGFTGIGKSGPAPVLGKMNEDLIHDHIIEMADA